MFKFRFQKILDIKTFRENQVKNELALLRRDVELAQAHLEQIRQSMRTCLDERRALQLAGRPDPFILMGYINYLERLRREAAAAEERVADLEKQAEACRLRLVQAAKERRTFEKLSERDQKKFKENELKAEQLSIDEMGTMLFLRRKRASEPA